MTPDRLRAYLDYITQEAAVVRGAVEGIPKGRFEADPILR